MPIKPSENEEKYFLELELKQRLEKVTREQRTMAESEKNRLKELHYMHCPKCGQLLATEKYGNVEVDVCTACKGVWLDANELESIVESKGGGTFRKFLKIVRAS